MEAATVPPTQEELEQAALAALTVILLSPNPAAMVQPVTTILTSAFGVAGDVAKLAAGLILPAPLEVVTPDLKSRTAAHWVARTAAPRRAAYIVAAVKRLAETRDLDAERRFFAQHQNAERARRDSARQVDRAAERFGPVLGWHARMDERTTAACRAAHRHNFSPERPPTLPGSEEGERIVGYPGQPHGGACRCVAGPAWPGGTLLT